MDHREANRAEHPLACTCVRCVAERLRGTRGYLESDGTVHTSNYSELRSAVTESRVSSLCFGGKGMLRMPVSLLIGLCGLWGVVLGAHGLYCHFCWLDLVLSGSADKLFLTWSVPGKLGVSIEWMSERAFQSWFVPAAFFVGGWVVVSWSNFWNSLSRLLSKARLW